MNKGKLLRLLGSRKFWATVVSMIVSLGVLLFGAREVSAADQAQVVDAIMVVAGAIGAVLAAIGYNVSTAIEDAAQANARSWVIEKEPTKWTD